MLFNTNNILIFQLIKVLLEELNENGFILNIEKSPTNNNDYKRFQIASLISDSKKKYVLLQNKYNGEPKVIKVDEDNISLLQKYIEQLSTNETNLFVTKRKETELIGEFIYISPCLVLIRGLKI